jgi:ASC-1-like (ASCH) protein
MKERDNMNVHTMRVLPNYFALLRSGNKRVEFRLFDEKRRRISVGDKVCFVCQTDPRESLPATVSQILHSRSFADLLNQVPPSMLGGISKEHQLSDLRNFYNAPDEHKYGVIALVLK